MPKAPAKSPADELRELGRELPRVTADEFDKVMRGALQVPAPEEKPARSTAKRTPKAKKAKR